jgi:3-polyprenyl-4-hydroxybenzoate decarboxylase
MVKMDDLMKKMETDPAVAAAELEKLSASDEVKDFEALIEKMNKIIDANPVAKKVDEDKAWQEEFAKENGIPDL